MNLAIESFEPEQFRQPIEPAFHAAMKGDGPFSKSVGAQEPAFVFPVFYADARYPQQLFAIEDRNRFPVPNFLLPSEAHTHKSGPVDITGPVELHVFWFERHEIDQILSFV